METWGIIFNAEKLKDNFLRPPCFAMHPLKTYPGWFEIGTAAESWRRVVCFRGKQRSNGFCIPLPRLVTGALSTAARPSHNFPWLASRHLFLYVLLIGGILVFGLVLTSALFPTSSSWPG